MRLRIAVFAACLLAAGASAAIGDDAVLAEIYGRGVHAYFGGRYEEAEVTLTDAITQGSKDPRVFYYRGLTLFRLGRLAEANSDFALGAKEEVKDVALSAAASRSLTRIQGGPRQLIEKARQQARKEYRATQTAVEKARYEAWESNEKRMLRTPPPPAEEVTKPAPVEKPAEPATEETKPAEEAKPAEEPKTDTPPAKPAEDPFGGDTKPAEPAKPAEPSKDPFGG